MMQQYADALDAYGAGATWDEKISYWGTAEHSRAINLADLDPEDIPDELIEEIRDAIIADVEAHNGTFNRERTGDIRRGVKTALKKQIKFAQGHGERGGEDWRERQRKPKPQTFPRLVRQFIAAGRDVATVEDLRELSPQYICPASDPLARRVHGEQQMLALFGRREIIHMRQTKDDHTAGRVGENMRTAEDWTDAKPHPVDAFEIVRVNPFTGNEGVTASGEPSFIAQGCVAAFRHMLCEFDEMPLADQCRFWAGFVRCSPLAGRLVCITDSGKKSLHAALRVDAADPDAWNDYKAQIIGLFATDPECNTATDADWKTKKVYPFRLDVQALAPLAGMRLAGARRKDTGRIQALAYVRPEWFDSQWQRELNPPAPEPSRATPPPSKPMPSPADGLAAHCAACAVLKDCKRAFGKYWADRSHGGVGCMHPFHGWKHADALAVDHAAIAAQEVLFK